MFLQKVYSKKRTQNIDSPYKMKGGAYIFVRSLHL